MMNIYYKATDVCPSPTLGQYQTNVRTIKSKYMSQQRYRQPDVNYRQSACHYKRAFQWSAKKPIFVFCYNDGDKRSDQSSQKITK